MYLSFTCMSVFVSTCLAISFQFPKPNISTASSNLVSSLTFHSTGLLASTFSTSTCKLALLLPLSSTLAMGDCDDSCVPQFQPHKQSTLDTGQNHHNKHRIPSTH
eukprot:GFUD01012801.1.p1 GENE.GFUD01012801.1~~GFUD01012801.1.p1  ORF type:complete len:105 (-),score=24.33 GFUD01012801.1:172-486(-)